LSSEKVYYTQQLQLYLCNFERAWHQLANLLINLRKNFQREDNFKLQLKVHQKWWLFNNIIIIM